MTTNMLRPPPAATRPDAPPAPPRPDAPPTAAHARIRPLRTNDGLEVGRIFRETLALGRPVDLDYADLVAYQRLCLDWYLTAGRAHARVVEQDGAVVGYLLACLDQAAFDAWARRRAVRWAAAATWRAATMRMQAPARRFLALRVQDGLAAWWGSPPPPFPAHAHLNLTAGVRDAGIGHRLVGCMDELVEAAGGHGWFGEVNVPRGTSLSALERQGARIVHRTRSRTFSWLLGGPVSRCTVVRTLADRPTRLRTDA